MNASKGYFAILAGCNSDRAPVHILSSDDSLALTPETLQRRDLPQLPVRGEASAYRKFSQGEWFALTGDGLSFLQRGSEADKYYCYNNDTAGLSNSFLDLSTSILPLLRGVSADFCFQNKLRCAAKLGGGEINDPVPFGVWKGAKELLAENAPVIFRLRFDKNSIPPGPPQIACFSYFDTAPFVEIPAPELAGSSTTDSTPDRRWAFFDPYSLSLATLTADRTVRTTHKLSVPEPRGQPILINWPDTTFNRGAEWRFKPVLLGGTKFSAEIVGKPNNAVTVDAADGSVRCSMPPDEFDFLQLLTLKVPATAGGEIDYPISLHAAGPDLPFATLASAERAKISMRGAGYTSMGMHLPVEQLRATTHVFNDPVVEIQGPIAGFSALVTAASRVDFFSLQTRKVVASIPSPPGARYYGGSGALFEYDPAKLSLTRISVPDGHRETTIALPASLKTQGIGIGSERNSPVTLAIQVKPLATSRQLADMTIPATAKNLCTVAVLDGITLRTSGWAQPVTVERILNQPEKPFPFGQWVLAKSTDVPSALPASHSGRLVTMPGFFLILSPSYAVACPCQNFDTLKLFNHMSSMMPGGSISGWMAASADGQMFKGGTAVSDGAPPNPAGASSCGRYKFIAIPKDGYKDACLQVRVAETDKPLMLIARLALNPTDAYESNVSRFYTMLGDEGPLAVLHPSGKIMQLIEMNIPEVSRKLLSEEFHVVSQPIPFVAEGGTLQYQVRVNNPDAVRAVRLQTPVPGAHISPQGLLILNAPARIKSPTQIQISIDLEGKSGKVVSHTFFVSVAPQARTAGRVGPI